MKILLGYFNAKLGRENIFKPIIGNENLHRDSKDNGARFANLATSKNLVVRRTIIRTKTFVNTRTPIVNSQLATAHVLRKVVKVQNILHGKLLFYVTPIVVPTE